MPGLFKTSNPALNAKTFEGRLAEAGEAMTLQGTINKAGFLLFLRLCHSGLDMVACAYAGASSGPALDVGRTDCGLHFFAGYDIQEGVVAGHGADLRALPGPRAGRALRVDGAALPRHRAAGPRADVWRDIGDARAVYVGLASSDHVTCGRRGRGDQRDLPGLHRRYGVENIRQTGAAAQ